MIARTDAATTDDWLEANAGITISAYVQSYTPTAAVLELPPLAVLGRGTLDRLIETIVPFPAIQRPTDPCDLVLELQAWDALSDEAFWDFEKELG